MAANIDEPVYMLTSDDELPQAAAAAPAAPPSSPELPRNAKRSRAQAGENGNPKVTKFIFTLFHPDLNAIRWEDNGPGAPAALFPSEVRERFVKFTDDCEYMVYSVEKCKETGRYHLQGFVRLMKRLSWTQVTTKLFGIDCKPHYVAKQYGKDADMRAYCMKDETHICGPFEYGVFNEANKPGRRSDLEAACAELLGHRSLKKIAEDRSALLVRYAGGFEKLLAHTAPAPPALRPMRTICIWGGAGLGKTTTAYKLAREMFQEEPYVCDLEFPETTFDEYRAEKVLLIDEFDWRKASIHFLKRICQPNKLLVKARYHNHFAAWELVVICSNSSPDSWWTGPEIRGKITADDCKAIFRRVGGDQGECRHYTGFDEFTFEPKFDRFGERILE